MSISQILASDTALTLVGGLLGTVWTFFRSKDWYRRAKKQRYFRGGGANLQDLCPFHQTQPRGR